MKVIFQSSVPFRFSFRLMICDFSLAGCELWIGRTIHVGVALPRVWEPGSLSESAKLGRSFLGRGYPCCFGGVTVAVFLLPVTLPPFRNSHCIGVWGVLLTSLAIAVTDLTGRNVGEEKFILVLGLRLQSTSLREHGGRCLPSGRRVCLGPFSSS